jgi:hypothetical protein
MKPSSASGLLAMPTPEQILEYGKRRSRSLQLEVNVIAYFGQVFQRELFRNETVVRGVTHASIDSVQPK